MYMLDAMFCMLILGFNHIVTWDVLELHASHRLDIETGRWHTPIAAISVNE